MEGLTLVRGRAPSPAVERLVLDVFDVDLRPIAAQGLSNPTDETFCFFDDRGALVGSAAVFVLTLMVGGRIVEATGVQGVATRPDWRRRGVARALLRHVLAWCDEQARPVLLMTEIPAFYEPMGFSRLPQVAFRGPAPWPVQAGEARLLDLTGAGDMALLSLHLRNRHAVSDRFAVVGGAGAFLLALLGSGGLRAWWVAGLDCLIVTGPSAADSVCLVDVVTPAIPALAVILGALRVAPVWLETRFPPDRLGWNGVPCSADALPLMLRGDLAISDAFMLPETAWF